MREGMQPAIETALPSGIGQAPIFRSFGPQKMAGGEGDEPDRPPTPTLAARLAMWRSTVLGDRYRRPRCPSWRVLRPATSTLRPPSGHPGGGQGVGKVWCRPAAAGTGAPARRRRDRQAEATAGGQPRRRTRGLRPANTSGLPPVANGRLGHQSAGMMAIPVAGGQVGVGSAKASSASAIWPRRPSSTARAWPTHPRISQYTVRLEASTSATAAGPSSRSRACRSAHRPRLGAVTGVSRNSAMPASSSARARRRSSRTSHSSARAMIAAPPRTSRWPAETVTALSMAASISAR